MLIHLHKQATTAPIIRAAIHASTAPEPVLADRFDITEQTAYKWRRCDGVKDRSHTTHRLQTTLTPAQVAVAAPLRKTLMVSLDDLLAVVREFMNANASRTGLDRCPRRHGVGNLPDLKVNAEEPKRRAFKAYEPRSIHIDVKHLPRWSMRPVVATSSWPSTGTRRVFIRILTAGSAAIAGPFLRDLERPSRSAFTPLPSLPIRRGTRDHAALLCLALQPSASAISPWQQDAVAGNVRVAQTPSQKCSTSNAATFGDVTSMEYRRSEPSHHPKRGCLAACYSTRPRTQVPSKLFKIHSQVSLRTLIALIGFVLTVGCSPRGSITIEPAAAETGAVREILVATTRGATQGSAVLSSVRSERLSFFDFGIAVPPDRAIGTVTFPKRVPPDSTTEFLTVSAERLADKAAFATVVRNRLELLPPNQREVLVFVHGFNTTFAEGLYRQAQMSKDFGVKGISVNYAWPSAGNVFSYASDLESVLFARDGLEDLLITLTRTQASRIVIVGHSMGAQLVMETLRQMTIRGAPEFFHKLASVVLFAPDVDLDVFRLQVASLGKMHIPIFVFVSNRDRALQLSSRIRGGTERLGSIDSTSELGDLSVTVIDISHLDPSVDSSLHSKAATSSTMIALFNGMGTAGLEMFREADRRSTILAVGQRAVENVGETVFGPNAR